MVNTAEETGELESTTVGVYRTAAVIKGGRRFSFSSLVVVGDRSGRVALGYGKANQVPPAIEKAQKLAKRGLKRYPLVGRTIPHEVTGRFGACKVRLIPASPGTGVIASHAVRAPLEMLGVQDCLTKSFGSNNAKNLVKAVINGLDQLRSKELVEETRGTELGVTAVEEALERGQAFMPTMPTKKKPAEEEKSEKKGQGKGRGGKKRGGRGRGRKQSQQGGGEAQGGKQPKGEDQSSADTAAKDEQKPQSGGEQSPESNRNQEGNQ